MHATESERRSCPTLCSFYFEEALGMIGTFINHCNETIRAVDLSHTSFFKTGWECLGVLRAGIWSAGFCRRIYRTVIFFKIKIRKSKRNRKLKQKGPKS
jgi:hypothetical protein